MSTSILLDPYVEATARLMCQEAGLDPDTIVPIPDAVVTIDGQRRPVAMTGPQWMAYAVEAGQRLDEAEKRMRRSSCRRRGGRDDRSRGDDRHLRRPEIMRRVGC